MTEKLLVPRIVYRYETPEAINPVKVDESRYCDTYEVGESRSWAVAAPGIGRIKYRVTRIDSEGVWGVMIEDTTRILDPSEVV
jgi:hypothetical protein